MADTRPSALTPLQHLLAVVHDRDARAGLGVHHADLVGLFELDYVDYEVLAREAFRVIRVALRPDKDSDVRGAEWDLPLFHQALRKALVTDLLFEDILTKARSRYLTAVAGHTMLRDNDRRMMVSLACQALNNEHIWSTTADEDRVVGQLCRGLQEKEGPLALEEVEYLVACAMYVPVWTIVPSRLARTELSALWADVAELARRQENHETELSIRDGLRSFGMSGDPTTDAVRNQYEESPYPRWFGITRDEPSSLSQELDDRFGGTGGRRNSGPLRVLIAGCGSGRHALKVASRYSDVEVVATDISKTSLCHAVREARALGVANVEFFHGDLLRVADLQMSFDVIESVGVLHCLASPLDGLNALVGCLRPNGHLRIGVYSGRARRRLNEFDDGTHEGPGTGRISESRRAQVIASRSAERDWFVAFPDFYYRSGCRDLLSPAHEVTFTPAQLSAWLAAAGLEFLGYDRLSEQTVSSYVRRFPNDPQLRDLALWEQFEADYPDTFRSMPIFWAKRSADTTVSTC